MKETIEYRVNSDDTPALFSDNLSRLDFSEMLTGLNLNASVSVLDSLILGECNKACRIKYKTLSKKKSRKTMDHRLPKKSDK